MIENISPNSHSDRLLLEILKSNLKIEQNTLTKPQETLEFKMKQNQSTFIFSPPIILTDERSQQEQWLMGVTSLEVYNSVYNINDSNNTLKIATSKSETSEST